MPAAAHTVAGATEDQRAVAGDGHDVEIPKSHTASWVAQVDLEVFADRVCLSGAEGVPLVATACPGGSELRRIKHPPQDRQAERRRAVLRRLLDRTGRHLGSSAEWSQPTAQPRAGQQQDHEEDATHLPRDRS